MAIHQWNLYRKNHLSELFYSLVVRLSLDCVIPVSPPQLRSWQSQHSAKASSGYSIHLELAALQPPVDRARTALSTRKTSYPCHLDSEC